MMRAVRKLTAAAGAAMVTVPVPKPGDDDVLIQIKAAAICGTDLHLYDWNAWAQGARVQVPLTLGHECCGYVVDRGRNVRTVAGGDYVSVETHVPCGRCYQCLNGEQHICNNLRLFGVHMDGCFTEYAVVPAVCARPIPESIPPRIGAIFEPLGTSLRSAAVIEPAGATVAVIGCGPIGLFAVASLRALGAATIFALDVSEDRLAVARAVGADFTVNPRKSDPKTVIFSHVNWGCDAIIEASGNEQAIQGCFSFLRKGGRVALVGLPSAPVSFNLGPDVVFKEARVIGIHGRRMFETWTMMESLLKGGSAETAPRLAIDPILTHTLPLDEFEAGIGLLHRGEASKIILIP